MKRTALSLALAASFLSLYGCSSGGSDIASNTDVGQLAAESFIHNGLLPNMTASNAKTSTAKAGDVSLLTVDFDSVSEENKFKIWPHIRFAPKSGHWNWNDKGSLKVLVKNPSDSDPLSLVFKLSDRVGMVGSAPNALNYAFQLQAGEEREVELLFNGTQRQLPGYFGGEKLDLKTISEFQVYVQGPADAQQAALSQFELVGATGDFIASDVVEIDAGPIPTVATLSQFETGNTSMVFKDLSNASQIKVVDGKNQDKALEVVFSQASDYPSIAFRPSQPWDWSKQGSFNLAFDIENPTDDPVQVYVRVDQGDHQVFGGTADGVTDSMVGSMAITPNSDSTYYMALTKPSQDAVSGMRGEPPRASYNAQAITYSWGEEELDKLDSIYTVQLFLMQPNKDYKLVVNNLRLIPDLVSDTSRFDGLIDQFGQYIGSDWPEKVHSLDELQQQGQQELAERGKAKQNTDRSKFGGWSEGPKFEATGFFRVEKTNGQWNMIDPEGNIYFMTGIDNFRTTDTMTITGVDYQQPEGRQGGEVKSKLRRSLFTWLPEEDSPLAQAYDYVPFVHKGAVEKGEVFSFYLANLMRKYNTDSAQEALDIWRDVSLDRNLEWGFTSLGNWADPSFYGNERVPYVANGWTMFGGEFKKISSGNDYWGPIPDPFDPAFKQAAQNTVDKIATEVEVNDPWLIGVFIDNEMSWGNTANEANRYGLVVNALSYDAAQSPAKKALTDYLQQEYKTVDNLAQKWGQDINSWDSFAAGFDYRDTLNPAMKADYGQMLEMIASQYFSVVQQEVARVLPNHMYLGARFADWGITPEVAKGAAPHVDVMSYNLYANDLKSKGDWSRLPKLDKPSIIGEFHFGSTDTGLFHGGIVTTPNQKERGKMFTHYMNSILENPYFVGAHWFQYTDSPATGRAWDGENYNVGFVTVTDTPYRELVKQATQFNRTMYPKRLALQNQ
ncbi:beta-agarase [Vibrio sp. SM6]|uniref:Beta-agarase n=1 Tax=Vibrio agarilyticus TaxID=2726741 RepID=A0A7X8YI49_9VIBR|nr:beta-galactosidase [Vibrio agarilyticus]NLS14216.1 beta-agarase [Vibrio agarilyticus]